MIFQALQLYMHVVTIQRGIRSPFWLPFWVNQAESWLWIRSSLLEGSCASMHCVSKVIPRNVMHCDGPSNFSIARGIPRS